jgi:hypothetical protein
MVPAETPAVIAAPTTPDTIPRSPGRKRSATIVVIAGCIELRLTVATSHSAVTPTMPPPNGIRIVAAPPTTPPMAIQGVRRPKRDRVRSESAPDTGVVIVLNTDVMA